MISSVQMVRTRRDRAAIRFASDQLGLSLLSAEAVSMGRTGIYRALLEAGPDTPGFPLGRCVQAVHVIRAPDSPTPPQEMHHLLHQLGRMGAPVVVPTHRDVIITPVGQVGFWPWLEHCRLTAREWGELTGGLHRAGERIPHPRIYDPARAFVARLRRIRELTSMPGHPLYGDLVLLRSFEAALDAAVSDALKAAASGPLLLVHGDNQPANVMGGPAGPVLIDFERMVTGPAAVDLAGLLLGIQHYGYPHTDGVDFRAGYGPLAPALEQARPYARVRELSGVAVSMIQAGDSPQMEDQLRVRRHAIADPGQGEPWTYLSTGRTSRLRPRNED